MNSHRFVTLSRLIAVLGFALSSAAVQAGGNNVYWSVNVDAPMQGSGRLQTSFSNTRGGMYREPAPVVYAPAPVVIHAPGRVHYRDEPRYYGHRHHHHHRHGARVAKRVVHNVHNGLARLHQDLANLHAARADAWAGGRRGAAYRDDRDYRDDRRAWRDHDRRGYGRDQGRGHGYER